MRQRLGFLSRAALAAVLNVSLATHGFAVPSAIAQVDTDTKEAKTLFDAGVALYKQNRFEEARVKFKAAYALKRRPSIALNLANAELQTQRPLDALGHYRDVLSMSEAKASDQEDAQAGVTEARKQIGIVQVTPATASVTVDGEARGLEGGAVEVMPGPHAVVVRVDGRETSHSVNVAAGETISVGIKDKPEPPPAPSTMPAPAASSAVPMHDAAPPEVTPPPAPPPTPASRGRIHPLSWVGAGLTLATTSVGIVLEVMATDSFNTANRYASVLETRDDCSAPSNPPRECNTTARRAEFRALGRDAVRTGNQLRDVRDGFFVAAGVLGVATIVSFIFLRRRPVEPTAAWVPVIAPRSDGLGLTIVGSF